MLLGAVACGSGLGYFLKQANADREFLNVRLRAAETQMAQTKSDSDQLAKEANTKVEIASQEVARMQKELQSIENERHILAKAIPLAKPDGRSLKSWIEAFSIPLGISIRLPTGAIVTEYETRIESAIARRYSEEKTPWISIKTYDAGEEYQQTQPLTQTEPVSFLVGGNLLMGVRGIDGSTSSTVYVLRLVINREPKALIWTKTAANQITEEKIRQSLATLSLRS